MNIQKVVVGELRVNCYVVKSGSHCFVVDPGDESDKILNAIDGLVLDFILLTHCHFDHTLALEDLKFCYPKVPIYVTQDDKELLRNLSEQKPYSTKELKDFKLRVKNIEDNKVINFGKYKIKVIETPGHSHGSVCYLFDNNLFSGDTLFYHTIGRTDFWTSDPVKMRQSLKKLADLPEEVKVYPGHGPQTTIEEELKNGYLARL
jgi:glyoxylase-like metal-dependent hydrolase (beta-lactamase superfamily II)